MELAQILHLNPDILAKPITPKPFQSKLVPPRRQTIISPKVHSVSYVRVIMSLL